MKADLQLFFIFCFFPGFSFSLLAQTKNKTYVDYIDRYSDIAVEHRDKYKIPASITLAQGLLESGAGASELARTANNHFGIKCRSDWVGDRVYKQDDGPNDCFRKYKSVEESYADHAKFLLQYPHYDVLFTYNIRDYAAWAKGLQACGYATDKGYANKLIGIIEGYELYEYDTKTLPKNTAPPITSPVVRPIAPPAEEKKETKPVLRRDIYIAYNLLYVIANEGDSFEKIAKDVGFKAKDLIKYNDASENYPLAKGDIVYLQQKKAKADKPYFEHLVKIGESMHSISQLYGIRLKDLCQMNKKKVNYITEGDVIRLR